MEIPYTAAAVGAVLLILQLVLMMSTGIHRGKTLIGVGVGDDKDLERKMRRHGNLAENAAIFVVVLALTEGIVGGGAVVVAFGALNAARCIGAEVPADVSIIGFDDLPAASWPIIRLTTVSFDLEAMVRRAADLLVRRIEEPDRPVEQCKFRSELVVRDTLGSIS